MKRSFGLLLLLPVVVGCTPPAKSDPAAWEKWVHDEVKEQGRLYGPTWQQPGIEAAVVQFGVEYRDRRDAKRLDADGIDRQLVIELREELVRKGVPVHSADGVSWVDLAAAQARNTLCPEDIRRPDSGTGWWVAGGVAAAALLLLLVLSSRKKSGQAQPAG